MKTVVTKESLDKLVNRGDVVASTAIGRQTPSGT